MGLRLSHRTTELLVGKKRVLTALTVLAVALSPWQARAQDTPWRQISEDLEIVRQPIGESTLFTSELLAVRTGLSRFRFGVIRAGEFNLQTASVRALCRRSRAVACINANFFDENQKPLGLVISRGIRHQPMHLGGRTLTGVFQAGRAGPKIYNRADFSPLGVMEAVQAGPRLIVDGETVAGLKDTSSKRSGICIDRAGRAILFGSFSGISGASISQLQRLLLSEPLGCVDALNLDGGGSAQLYISDEIPDAPQDWQEMYFPGHDEVPVALGIFVKQ